MKAFAWLAATVFVAVSFVGCSKDSGTGSTVPPSVRITLSSASVVANGTNTVTVSVTDPGGGPITVTTDRGTFPSGLQTATVPGAAGSLALRTCDATTTSSCAGTVHINAAGIGTTGAKTLTFGSLATLCTTDCEADPACATRPCTLSIGGAGICSSTLPSACLAASSCTPSPAGATTETSCTDGIDNDCSGGADGTDPTCEGQPCQTGSSTHVWRSGACTDVTIGLGIKVTPTRTRLPANGTTTTTVVVEVTASSAPAPHMTVSAATTLGTLSPATADTDADGKATFTFKSSATVGVATITASLVAAPAVTQTATITMPRLGSFQLPTRPMQVMGAKGSAWNEMGWLQIQVLDDAGDAYPDGLDVTFVHHPLGGSTLAVPLATVAGCTAPSCIAHVGVVSSGGAASDSGLASTAIYSGTVAGTLAVTATATAAGVTLSAPLPTATVIGAKASGDDFSVVCGPRNLPALAETDCSISLVDAPFTCEALLKDRFGNVLGTETQVMFVAEAGSIGHIATTPAYDPAAGGASQMGLGAAVQGVNTLGAGLPFDVAPDAAEPSVVDAFGIDGCGPRTRNPRDGVVTIIAIADGEEAFFDANGNGGYDAGEPFVDQGEPYVDQNDNGAYDAGEWFLDVDGDRAYTTPNGAWDAATKIWTQTVVVYTGEAATFATGAGYLGTRWADALASACTATPAPTPFHLMVSSATAAGESKPYAVAASDLNLNFLTMETSYSAAVEGGAEVTVDYQGLPSYADELGFFYRYWPCANGGAGACASQCRATGGPYPCVMKPAVAAYSCGVASSAVVKAGAKPASAAVDWKVDVPWDVYGGGKTSHAVRTLWGDTY